MQITLIITGLIVLIAFFSVLYKFFNILEIARKKNQPQAKRLVGTSNTVNALLFLLFFIVGSSALIYYTFTHGMDGLLPEAASVHGKETDFLFWLIMGIVISGMFIVFILLFSFPFLYRYRPQRKAAYYHHNNKLELLWTVIPAAGLIIMLFYGLNIWNEMTSYPEDKDNDVCTFEIMGKQFNWEVRYPGKDGILGSYDFRKIDATNSMGINFEENASFDDFIPREIHIPKGKKILLKIRSRDVLHSVFMPHFRVKMDAVPGLPTQFWFVPTKTTEEMRTELRDPEFNYEMACTEVCGTGHFAMRMVIVVDEPADYEKWQKAQEPWAKQNQDYLSSIGIDYNQKMQLVAQKNSKRSSF